MDPAEAMLRTHFAYDHLPGELQLVSRIFAEAAQQVIELVAPGPDRTVAVRKLWEAKNCAVIQNGFAQRPSS
jgi:hypothetical protein